MSSSVLPEDAWPEAPRAAQYKRDEPWWTGWEGHGWVVNDAPPEPWPFLTDFPRAAYGPPGTVWLFTLADVAGNVAHLPGGAVTAAINAGMKKLGVTVGGGSLLLWRTPTPLRDDSGGHGMRWYQVTIIGKLGQYESVAHTFKFRTRPAPDIDQSVAECQAVADAVRDQWPVALATGEQNAPMKAALSPDLVYTEVRAAYLEQTAPAAIATVPGRKGPKKVFTYPRPTYLVPTQYSTFSTNNVGLGTGGNLPYEVAIAATFLTGRRGGANRGRVFLGPWTKGAVDNNGLVSGQLQQSIITGLTAGFFVPLKSAAVGIEPVVLSRAYCGNAPITGVTVGSVPDAQRRRRRSLAEFRPPARFGAL